MAAVEKRKPPFLALLYIHLMFASICVFMVALTTGIPKIFFGIVMTVFYYFSVYDYSLGEASYHKKPYTEMTESYKYALINALVSIFYIALPVAALLIYECVWTRSFYCFFDSMFTYTPLFTLGETVNFSLVSALVIAATNFGVSFLGYYHGLKDTSISKIINKFVYHGNPPVKENKR